METVAALGLFAITISAVGNFLVHQIRTAASNHVISLAYALAEQELEDVRAQEYEGMVPRSSSVTKGQVTFTVTTEVETDTPAPHMKQITVDVDWQGPEGTKNVQVETIYTKVKR